MATLTISLPKDLKSFLDAQIAGGKYADPSEFLASLLRAAQRKRAEEKLVQLVKEAEESGPATPMTREDWANIRREALKLKQLAEEKAKNGKTS